jgi:hypothetical protein
MRSIGEFSIARHKDGVAFSRRSMHSGEMHCRIFEDLNFIDFAVRFQTWIQREGLIQDLFPGLSASEREFIQTGITDSEWDEVFAISDSLDTELSEEPAH